MIKINSTKLLVQDVPEKEEKTASGILLPSGIIKVNSMKGIVKVVGEGTADIKIPYEVGDTVLYHPNAGSKFTFNDEEYKLLDVADVFLGGSL